MAEPTPAPPIIPPPAPPTSLPLHTLPPPFLQSALTPITQGAEALVYKTTFLTPHTPVVVKYRPPKPYRHPTLDRRLTKQRLLAEARSLVRVKRDGVNVPGVLGADWEAGWLVLEYIEGASVRAVLDTWAEDKERRRKQRKDANKEVPDIMDEEEEKQDQEAIIEVMRRVGREIGKLHNLGVCHGDLTTSNIMVRYSSQPPPRLSNTTADPPPNDNQQQQQQQQQPRNPQGKQTPSTLREAAMTNNTSPPSPPAPKPKPKPSPYNAPIYLIDFGLTTTSIHDEDKAVDLYVLERAFAATHPAAEPLFQQVLRAYGESCKGAKGVLRRLEGVRGRGRKRSMLG